MKEYQLTALFSITSAAVTVFFAAVAYYSTSYASAVTAFLIAICMAFITACLIGDAVIEYRAARRLDRWSAKQ